MSLFATLRQRRARVLFVSSRNACRTQMAEAFARAWGDDAMLAASAGLVPADAVSSAVRTVMAEHGVPLFADQAPRLISTFDLLSFDVIVNLGGAKLPSTSAVILEPLVPSPLENDLDSHRAVRDRTESFVRFLVDHFRRAKEWTPELTREPSSSASPRTRPAPSPAIPPQPGGSMPAAF